MLLLCIATQPRAILPWPIRWFGHLSRRSLLGAHTTFQCPSSSSSRLFSATPLVISQDTAYHFHDINVVAVLEYESSLLCWKEPADAICILLYVGNWKQLSTIYVWSTNPGQSQFSWDFIIKKCIPLLQ